MGGAITPSTQFRKKLLERGGDSAYRCYQCATCSSVCELAPAEAPFPRRQMLAAQWGLSDRLAADPSLWLCHQCNDCSSRCPRDAKPGDVMQVLRGLAVEQLSWPGPLAKLVGAARQSWPLLIGLPIVFWIVLLVLYNGMVIPEAPFAYHDFVPHPLIYIVYIGTVGFVCLAMFLSGKRFWALMGEQTKRSGSFVQHLWPVLKDIITHRRFGTCEAAKPRKWGHFALFYGFVAAAVASGLIIVLMYGLKYELPLKQLNPVKILGNVAAVLLVVGGLILLANRLEDQKNAGDSRAFDSFLLGLVLLVTFTGVLTELGRIFFDPQLACTLYLVHLGSVLTLFFTAPYSKLAHLLYRTLAMVHERMTAPVTGTSRQIPEKPSK